MRQHTREQLRKELAQQVGLQHSLVSAAMGNTVDDRVRDPANQDLLIEAYIEEPRLRPPARRYIKQAKLYRRLFEAGYDKIEPEAQAELVALGLEWQEDLSGHIIKTLDDDYDEADAELRRQILLALADVDGPESARRLQEKFDAGSSAERKLILEGLVRMQNELSTDALIELHRSAAGRSRQEVLNSLARKAVKPSLDYVCDVACGNDPEAGCKALVQAGAPALAAAVKVSCDQDAGIRRAGGEAVAEILKLAPRSRVLKLTAQPGNYKGKLQALEELQAKAPFCRKYQAYARGFRTIGTGEESEYNPRLGDVTITYANGVLTVAHRQQKIVAAVTGARSFKLDLSAFRREGCEVKGHTGLFQFKKGRVEGEIPGCVRSSEASPGTDSYSFVSYRICGIEFK